MHTFYRRGSPLSAVRWHSMLRRFFIERLAGRAANCAVVFAGVVYTLLTCSKVLGPRM